MDCFNCKFPDCINDYVKPSKYKPVSEWTDEQVQKHKERCKQRYERLKVEGLCVLCGKRPADHGVRCYECWLKNKKYSRKRNKEGRCSHQVADLSEFWRGQREIKLLDPNLLACKDHEKMLIQLAGSGAMVDFTQGIDIRLTNPDNIALLNRVKTSRLHFAWDNPRDDLTEYFKRFSELTKVSSYRNKVVYVLVNYDSTIDEDLYRIYTLRDLGYSPYVMIYQKETAPKQIRQLQRWCNSRWIFRSVQKFEEYRVK